MKKIEAIVEPRDLDAVHADLLRDGVDWMAIGEVLLPDCGRLTYRGVQYVREYQPKIRLELALPDGHVASAVDVLTRTATDILVIPIHDAVRIRTGEHLVWPRPDRTQGPSTRVAAPRPAA
jgi:nitrogen regulatory protein P-II 2